MDHLYFKSLGAECFIHTLNSAVWPLITRELLNAHKDNLGTMVKLVIFNELSNARNPNNMQVLHTLLQHSPEQAPKVKEYSMLT